MNDKYLNALKEIGAECDHGTPYLTGINIKKFAELIVRECAELMYGRDENGNCKDGDVIKKHFGVEE